MGLPGVSEDQDLLVEMYTLFVRPFRHVFPLYYSFVHFGHTLIWSEVQFRLNTYLRNVNRVSVRGILPYQRNLLTNH